MNHLKMIPIKNKYNKNSYLKLELFTKDFFSYLKSYNSKLLILRIVSWNENVLPKIIIS